MDPKDFRLDFRDLMSDLRAFVHRIIKVVGLFVNIS